MTADPILTGWSMRPANDGRRDRTSMPSSTGTSTTASTSTTLPNCSETESSPSNDRWRVHFEGIEDRNAAEALTGTFLAAEPIEDPDVLWIHQLIGAEVVEVGGTARGRCVGVLDNPAADLLELESGALVPVSFVVSVVDGVVTIDPPDGLFELND